MRNVLKLPLVFAIALAGCTAEAPVEKTVAAPAPKPAPELLGEFQLVVGATPSDWLAPQARWCNLYLELGADGAISGSVDRPEDPGETFLESVSWQPSGQVKLKIKRTVVLNDDEEHEELWALVGYLRPIPGDEEARKQLTGQGTVSVTIKAFDAGLDDRTSRTRTYGMRFKAKAFGDETEELPGSSALPEPLKTPTTLDQERARIKQQIKAGKLDFESVPPELMDEARSTSE